MKTINPMNAIYYENKKNGRMELWADCYPEFTKMYIEELKERLGEDTKYEVRPLR